MGSDDRGYTALPPEVSRGGLETAVRRRKKATIQDQNKKLSSRFERVSQFFKI